MSMMKTTVALAVLATAGTAAHAVSYEIHNSQAGLLNAVQAMGPTTVGSGNFVGVGCAPGVACANVATNGVPGVSIAQSGNGSASFDNGLLNNLNGGYLEWSFANPQNGWGGTFAMTAGNAGLAFAANDKNLGWIDVTTVGAGQTLNGFFGFSSTDQFAGVRVSVPLPAISAFNVIEGTSYKMTDFTVAQAVPEPETYALMLAGLAGVVAFARRRQSKA